MDWSRIRIPDSGTHHLLDGAPLYDERFEEVLSFHAPGLAAVRRGEEAWHIDERGRPAYAHRFERTFGFYEARATVVGRDGWLHVLSNGGELSARRYSWCGNFQGGRCTVRESDGRYHHVDLAGEPAYGERWSYAGDYRYDIAVVYAGDGRATHVDLDGRPVHDRWFRDLDVFHKGYARARDDNGWMHVGRDGRPAYERRFAAVEPFYNGQARAERFDGRVQVIDESGRILVAAPKSRPT